MWNWVKGWLIYLMVVYYEIPPRIRSWIPIAFFGLIFAFALFMATSCMALRYVESDIGDPLDPIVRPSREVRNAWNDAYQESKRVGHEVGGCAFMDEVRGRNWVIGELMKDAPVQVIGTNNLRLGCPYGTIPWHTHFRDSISISQDLADGPEDTTIMTVQMKVRNFLRCTPSWGNPGTDYGLAATTYWPAGILVCGPNKYVLFGEKRLVPR